MRKLLLALLLLVPTFANAQTTQELMGYGVSPQLATMLVGDRDFASITVTGASSFTGDLTITGDLLPSVDETYNLGDSTQVTTWKGLYLASNGGNASFTEASNIWRIGTGNNTDLALVRQGVLVVKLDDATTFAPYTDGTISNGSASLRWADGFYDGLNMPNSTTIPATCAVGDYYHDTDSDDCIDTGSGDGAICVCKSTDTWALVNNI